MLQKEKMPDSSWKLIGIPISLWQLERDPGSPASPREGSLFPCQDAKRIPRCPSQLERSHDVAEQTPVLKGHPHCNLTIYPSFCCNLMKTMRLPPHCKMRPDSSALCAEQFCVHIKYEKGLDFLDGNPKCPQEHCNKSRWTLRSPSNKKELQELLIN